LINSAKKADYMTAPHSPAKDGSNRASSVMVDFVDRNPISVKDVVNSFSRKMGSKVFGIDGYELPDTQRYLRTPRSTKFSKFKVPSYIDEMAKTKSHVPGPLYDTVLDWKKSLKGRGKFNSTQRTTFTEQILKEGKLRPSPSPGQYFDDPKSFEWKVGNLYIPKGERYCSFIGEAQYRGSVSPAPKYEAKYVSESITQTFVDHNRSESKRGKNV